VEAQGPVFLAGAAKAEIASCLGFRLLFGGETRAGKFVLDMGVGLRLAFHRIEILESPFGERRSSIMKKDAGFNSANFWWCWWWCDPDGCADGIVSG
jgi:hypothetical protein